MVSIIHKLPLHCNSRDCSQAANDLPARRERGTAIHHLLSSIFVAARFGCGFAALRAFAALRSGAIACTIASACLAAAPPALTAEPGLVQDGSIPLPGVEGRLDHLAYDPASQRLFVAALENHTVEVVDLLRKKRIRQLTGISEPQGLLYVPEHKRLLVCSRGDGTCRSFDADTFAEGPWIDLGRNADNIRYDAAAKVVYIGSAGEPGTGLMSAIDLVSLLPANQGGRPAEPRSPADFLLDRPRQAEPKMDIALPSHPESFQLDPAHHRLLVNVPDAHQIIVLQIGDQGFTNTAAWPVTVGEKNFPMAFDPVSARLFIACRIPARLAAYDSSTGKLLAQAPCVGDADDTFYAATTRKLYVVGGDGFADVFQVAEPGTQLTLLAHVPTASRARTGLFIPQTQTLAVAAPHVNDGPAAVLLFQAR
ncbi:MAG TPA: hypothetical protein VMU04_22140 [Candidatus Acidoferrum sp.]|nr:hypothetical protein [Candidatus Acidoferrum sp.]